MSMTITPTPAENPDEAPKAEVLSAAQKLMKNIRDSKQRIDWVNVPFIVVFHVGAIAAFFFFSWTNLAIASVLYVIAGLGITVGYHRLLTHRSFKTPRWAEILWALAGAFALQGGPITWIALHRQHHTASDTEMDPHNIGQGFLHAHVLWLLKRPPTELERTQRQLFAPDLTRDSFYRWLEKYNWVPTTAVGLVLLAIGGWPMVFWGVCLRAVALYHATWFVNSAAHLWGSKPFKDSEGTNNWWVALVAFGEGWHNNHHKFPTSARHGLRNWQFDASWIVIKIMSYFRVAKNIKRVPADNLPWTNQVQRRSSVG